MNLLGIRMVPLVSRRLAQSWKSYRLTWCGAHQHLYVCLYLDAYVCLCVVVYGTHPLYPIWPRYPPDENMQFVSTQISRYHVHGKNWSKNLSCVCAYACACACACVRNQTSKRAKLCRLRSPSSCCLQQCRRAKLKSSSSMGFRAVSITMRCISLLLGEGRLTVGPTLTSCGRVVAFAPRYHAPICLFNEHPVHTQTEVHAHQHTCIL